MPTSLLYSLAISALRIPVHVNMCDDALAKAAWLTKLDEPFGSHVIPPCTDLNMEDDEETAKKRWLSRLDDPIVPTIKYSPEPIRPDQISQINDHEALAKKAWLDKLDEPVVQSNKNSNEERAKRAWLNKLDEPVVKKRDEKTRTRQLRNPRVQTPPF